MSSTLVFHVCFLTWWLGAIECCMRRFSPKLTWKGVLMDRDGGPCVVSVLDYIHAHIPRHLSPKLTQKRAIRPPAHSHQHQRHVSHPHAPPPPAAHSYSEPGVEPGW
ncbi:hypothetical protein BDQ17DRAFT_310913 [Cyathus striatus]|nr:hypothetical protein BDQ17DRAFT_310913 [Cyathus striatus]